MIINDSNLNALRLGFQNKLKGAYAGTKTVWQRFAMATNSSNASEGYPFTDLVGLMQEYFGEMPTEQLVAYLLTVKNRKFSRRYALSTLDIERDNIQLIPTQADAFGRAQALWPDMMLGEVFRAAFDGGPSGDVVCYDGAFLCDTSHVVQAAGGGTTTASNKITKALNFSTLADAQASFGLAKNLFQSRTDKDGNPLMLRPDTLVVGTDLEDVANAGMTLERLEDGKPNIYRNKCKVEVFDWVPTGQWFLCDLSQPLKPFVFQTERKPYFLPAKSAADAERDEQVDFGIKARGNVSSAYWQLIVGSDGTT